MEFLNFTADKPEQKNIILIKKEKSEKNGSVSFFYILVIGFQRLENKTIKVDKHLNASFNSEHKRFF